MASEAYKEKANLKKERQAEEVWNKISQIPQLSPLMDLHHKIKDLEVKRDRNRDYIEETSSNYQALRKNIKDFSKTQNIDKKKRWIALIDPFTYSLILSHQL